MSIEQVTQSMEELLLEIEDLKKANLKLREDLSEIKTTKEELQGTGNRLSSIYNSMSEGLALHEIVYNRSGEAVDYIITEINSAFETIIGLRKEEVLGKRSTEAYSVSEAPFIDRFSEVESTGKPDTFESYFPPLKKHFHISVFTPGKGKFATIFQDITERKHAEELLLRQNSMLDSINFILDAALTSASEKELGVACLDIARRITRSEFGFIGFVNDQFIEEIAKSDPFRETYDIQESNSHEMSPWRFPVHGLCGRVISDGASLLTNNPSILPDGIGLPVGKMMLESFLAVPLNNLGKTTGIIALGNRKEGFSETEINTIETIGPAIVEALVRKRADEDLQRSKKLIQSVLDNVNSGVALIDEAGSFTVCNPLFLKLFGLSENASIKNVNDQNWSEWQVFDEEGILLHVNDHPVRKAAMTGKHIDQQLVGVKLPSAGEVIWMLVSAEPIFKSNGDIESIICTYTDITRRRKAEKLLKESEERFKLALKNAPIGVAIQDRNLVYTWAYNQKTRSTEEIIGKTDADLFSPEDTEWINPLKASLLESGKEMNVERWLTTNGRRLYLGIHYEPILDSSGAITGLGAATIDLTDRKLAEELLAFQSQLLSEVNDAVFSSDSNYSITYWNRAAEKMFGWTREEVLGKNSGEFLKPKIEDSSRDLERSKLRRAGHWKGEVQYIRKDGTYFFAEVNSTVLIDNKGKDAGTVVVARDITAPKRAAEELKKSEALYRAIGESIDYGIWICDADGKNTYASESYLKLVGITQEQCSEFGWGDTLHPDDSERTIAAWRECSKNGNVWDIEHRFRGVDGKWHPILARGIPIRDDRGEVTMWAGINLDISKIKETEDALRESEERLRVTLNSIGDAVLSVDNSCRIVFLNPVAVKLMGWELEEAMGRQVQDVFRIINEITQEPGEDIIRRVLDESTIIEMANHTALITKDGRLIPIEDSAAPIRDQNGNVTGVIVVFHDVTEKRSAQIALRKSEERFRKLVKYAPAVIYEMDLNGNQFYSVNDAMCETLGYTREELLSVKPMELLEESSRDLFRDRIYRKLNNQEINEDVEYKVRKKNGDSIYALITVGNINDINETNPHVIVVAYNITERRRREESLIESEKKFRELVKYAPTAIYELDFATRKFTSVNDSMCKLSGYSREEIMTIDALELLDADSRKLFLSRISKRLKGESPDENVEYKVRSKDGSFIHAVLSMKFNFDEQGTLVGALVVGHDITERKRAAEELRIAGESLRENEVKLKELIATKDKFFNIVAHDLKNPFTSLIGSSELLYDNINKLTPEQIKRLALLLNDSAKGGYSILLNLLDWSRSQTGLLKISICETNLTALIAGNISEHQLSAHNKNISIINETENDIYLKTDSNMLNTILRNLLSNSIKFTHKFGKVVVAATKETDNVTILVKDNGIGISPDRIGKLFKLESRNSTPGTENEQGTGLGLKLSKEFTEKLGGIISVESVLDKGSVFRIRLPLI